MDKITTFDTINSILGKKHKFTLPFSEETRTLICKYDSERMHQIMFVLYVAQNTDEEFVKKSIAGVEDEKKRIIGFSICKD